MARAISGSYSMAGGSSRWSPPEHWRAGAAGPETAGRLSLQSPNFPCRRSRSRLMSARTSVSSSLGISVVICAHTQKRFRETCAAVASVQAQSLPAQEIILVVDHNPELQASLAEALPDVTVLANREARGLSGGKNTGAAAASG